MVWLIDDIAEAALGPVGLVVAVGVGAAVVARKRLVPEGGLGKASGLAGGLVAGGVTATEKAREWLSEQSVVERAQTALAEAGEWWTDLYAEARAEWEAGRAAEEPITIGSATERLNEAADSGSRPRGRGGRFVKKSSDA